MIGLYIGRSGVASPFGAAASLVVLLLWVHYSAQVFLLGAELTWVYAQRFGSLRHRLAGATSPGASPAAPATSAGGPPAASLATPAPAVPQRSQQGRPAALPQR